MRAALNTIPAGMPAWFLVAVVACGTALEVASLVLTWQTRPAIPPSIVGIDPHACREFCDGDGLQVRSWEPHRCECGGVRP